MSVLENYVDGLFRNQRVTPELKDLKEEIVSNMIAKRDDLVAQGMDAESAAERAKQSLSDVDFLIDGNQLTDVGRYRLECRQTVLLHSILFWIFSFPLLFTGYASVSYAGLFCVIVSGCACLLGRNQPADGVGVLSVTASERRRKMAWRIWGLFFLVAVGTMAALTFGSDIWFGRPLNISGPYQMANIAVRFYLPLLTIFVPITFSSFSKLLLRNRKGQEDE